MAKPNGVPSAQSVAHLVESKQLTFRELLGWMRRDELLATCRAHALETPRRTRSALSETLLAAYRSSTIRPTSVYGEPEQRGLPEAGDVARVRQRQYLVTAVARSADVRDLTRVELVGLDDDQQGRPLSVLWELELGARAYKKEELIEKFERLDLPRRFGAYLHAVQWSCVSVADDRRLQSPFRAGIKLLNHQLTPLLRALEQPRCKLFIADDVGLGKTIEAGLVLQELELRQRLEFTLIVCPAAICLQWQREMERRFGQRFEVYDREFVRQRRRQRGFGVNPWATQQRFIVSYQTLRRDEHLQPLLQHLARRGGAKEPPRAVRKAMLLLDEAHTVAPAAKGGAGSGLTELAGELTPQFEHHLFLSATPHNGYSESFSRLMNLLDPEVFSATQPIKASSKALEAVMVRRLKRDLAQLERPAGAGKARRGEAPGRYSTGQKFPDRRLVKVALERDGQTLLARFDEAAPVTIGKTPRVLPEVELASQLAEYTGLMRSQRADGHRTLINLQKRLLSSTKAFFSTLHCHIASLREHFGAELIPERLSASAPKRESQQIAPKRKSKSRATSRKGKPAAWEPARQQLVEDDAAVPDLEAARDATEDVWDVTLEREVRRGGPAFQVPGARAVELLGEMISLAERSKTGADAKVLGLLHWMRQHQCEGIALGGWRRGAGDRRWTDERVIIFSEYTATKDWLKEILHGALEGTEKADERILEFHGAMSDMAREYVQKQFTGDPSKCPVRILLATDAAREGLNLHKHCRHLFHFDIPWNPARLEQRNGRIDRAFQPAPEVFCHYFSYAERKADRVLQKVAEKVDTTSRQLPGLSDVLAQRLASALENGIDDKTAQAVDAARVTPEEEATERRELDADREAQLREDIDQAAQAINISAAGMRYSPSALRDALNVGLELCGIGPLERLPVDAKADESELETYGLPEMPSAWERTLDALREPRRDDEPEWLWRKKPLQPIVFSAPESIAEDRVQLHLRHPFVQRVLSRLLAQGFSAHDLRRATVIPFEGDARVLVLAFARATLFAKDATRLHDEVFGVAGAWKESRGAAALELVPEDRQAAVVEAALRLLDDPERLGKVPPPIQERVCERAGQDLSGLWPDVKRRFRKIINAPKKGLQPVAAESGAGGPQIVERLTQIGLVYLWPTTRL